MSPWPTSTYDVVATPQSNWARTLVQRLAFRGDETVLDAGCGTGNVGAAILPSLSSGTLLCVDSSAEMLSHGRLRLRPVPGSQVHSVQADMSALPFVGVIDVVVSSAAFHWVPDPVRLFMSIRRSLRAGGRLVAQCGGGPNLRKEIARVRQFLQSYGYSLDFDGRPIPWVFLSENQMRTIVTDTGFYEVEISLRHEPASFRDDSAYDEFLRSVLLWPFLERIHASDRGPLVSRLVDAARSDNPPLTVDYWRLDISATAAPTQG